MKDVNVYIFIYVYIFTKKQAIYIYGLSAKYVLQSIADVIAIPLANIFNACIERGIYPSQLRLSKIV